MANWTFLVLLVVCLVLPEIARCKLCDETTYFTVNKKQRETYKCGWWGWWTCSRYALRSSQASRTDKVCCAGSFGHVEDGCSGACGYAKSQRAARCPGIGICRDFECDRSGFTALPGKPALTFDENDDSERLLMTATAKCFVQYKCHDTKTCSKNVDCTTCAVVSTNNIAEVRDGLKVYRKACSKPGCKNCRSHAGCLDSEVKHTVTVECRASGYVNNGVVRVTLDIDVTPAEPVDIEINTGTDEPVQLTSNAAVGTVLLQISNVTIPAGAGFTGYTFEGPVSEITGEDLFEFDKETMQIRVKSDLSQEPSGTHELSLCANVRRSDTCVTIQVQFERITTTTPTTTTTGPTQGLDCYARGRWGDLPGFHGWCNSHCGPLPRGTCFYEESKHCVCRSDPIHAEMNCTARAKQDGLPSEFIGYLSGWCDLNCIAEEQHINCPKSDDDAFFYCECTVNEN